ncbi:MAG: cardiolipin synthase [Solobacterium sp.]|nr:cardiolipin synthase [Solobacterium sp.]
MKIIKTFLSRLVFILIFAIFEALILLSVFKWFGEKAAWIESILRILSIVIILMIVKNSKHLSSDMMWILLISALPVPGTIAYLFLGANLVTSRTYRNIQRATADARQYYVQDEEVLQEAEENGRDCRGQFRYISRSAGYPVYRNTGFDYYSLGDEGFPVMLEEMKKAERFIFLEYFIIEEGQLWNSMLAVMEEKAKQGVDVRVMYDDVGSMFTLSARYARQLEEKGIKCISFNRINPVLGIIMNHRDHRKIMVIDGKTAFSGGINLADEYINVKTKYGHWKDNVIRVKGEAVWSYTVMFLTHWNAIRKTDESFLPFKAEPVSGRKDGYIAPYGETPLDNEIVAQDIYMGILNQTNDYCYIFTPYLIIDTDMINALILAAKHGADVRIVTPGIPDKKLVWQITRSFYRVLIKGGVKVYEYTPGFVHSKVFVSDDEVAAVGTINLDYRSLYLHFENGTYIYGSEKIKEIRDDVRKACEVSHQVTLEEATYRPLKEFLLGVLRLFAPML